MLYGNSFKKFILVAGDVILLYFSLFIALTVRYAEFPSVDLINSHLIPFAILNLLWLLIFFIAGFYDIRDRTQFRLSIITRTMAIAGLVAVFFFYFASSWNISPKTNLFAYIFIASVLIWLWRKTFLKTIVKKLKIKIFFLGKDIPEILKFSELISMRPQFGYEEVGNPDEANIIIVPHQFKQDPQTQKTLYKMTLANKTIINFSDFYESITGKVPLSLVDEMWVLENIAQKHTICETIKRPIEFFTALILLIILIPLLLIVAILVKINSKGPAIFKNVRIGKNEKPFTLYKFRSMRVEVGGETDGKKWINANDPRVTFVGKFLRKTRIDELPQLWNVIKGDVSFIGARPDFIKFYELSKEAIPFYALRTITKPGLTGWGQINNQRGDSIEESRERLAYEIYYLKNRSVFLDIIIILKTLKTLVSVIGV